MLAIAAGCPRTVARHEIVTVETKEGMKLVIEERPYVYLREVIERSPSVKSATRMTDLKGKQEPIRVRRLLGYRDSQSPSRRDPAKRGVAEE